MRSEHDSRGRIESGLGTAFAQAWIRLIEHNPKPKDLLVRHTLLFMILFYCHGGLIGLIDLS